ncbi:MAG: hypothetical protein GXP45_03505 [bacterium]|nr:hypothetical protein [bacterium]
MLTQWKRVFAENIQAFLPDMSLDTIQNMVEIAPENISADLAFPCFVLSKQLKKSPHNIAEDLFAFLETLEGNKYFSHFEVV